MKKSLGHSGRRLLGAGLIAVGLLFSSFALANIISGNVSTGSSAHATYTLLTLNEPASVAPGDLLLANIDVNGGTPANVTPPTGWTQILRTDNDTNISMISYWKIASASEPTNYTWTIDSQTRAEGGITQYSGIDPTNPIDAFAGNTGLTKTATTSSITTSVPNEEVVALYGFDAGNSTSGYFSAPAGMTEKYDVTHIPLGPSTAADDVVQVTPGASGSKTSTITGGNNRNWASQVIALRPFSSTLNNSIIAYWKLDGDSSDATGNGHNGSDTNVSYTSSDGIIGEGANFTSASSSCIAIPDAADLKPTGSYTINSWVKLPSGGGADIFDTFSQNPKVAGIGFFFNPHSQLVMGRDTGTTAFSDYNPIVGTFDGGTSWHMITAVYDGTHMDTYVDGNSTPDASAAWPYGAVYDSPNYVRIGCRSENGTNEVFSDASMDEIGFWSRALTASEISQLYNSGTGRQYPF